MECDAVFLFRGDIRFDTRIRNFVSIYTARSKHVVVIQGSTADEIFEYDGAHIISFRDTRKGFKGFLDYWRGAARRVSPIAAKAYWASDLYSLPLAVWMARKSNATAGYDSREMYAHIGALRNSKLKQKFWYGLERFLMRYKPAVVTSGSMDSEYLVDRYGIEYPHVVRNVPRYRTVTRNDRIRRELGIHPEAPVMLYIGGLQEGRGISTMLQIAERLPESAFVFIGSGIMEQKIKQAITSCSNIYYLPPVANSEVLEYAASATLGFALIEPITLSYYLALPNKLFEYIMAGTPVIATYVPQIEKVIKAYDVGAAVPWNDCDAAVESIRQFIEYPSFYEHIAENCTRAAKDLCWEHEEEAFTAFAQKKGLL